MTVSGRSQLSPDSGSDWAQKMGQEVLYLEPPHQGLTSITQFTALSEKLHWSCSEAYFAGRSDISPHLQQWCRTDLGSGGDVVT